MILSNKANHMTFNISEEPIEILEPLETRVGLHPFLCGMQGKHIKLLTDCAMAKTFEPGELLFRQGEFANRFYLIETGQVALKSIGDDGAVVTIETAGAGNLIGWSWLFPPYAWHFDARAAEHTTALFFYGPILREYCEKDQTLGFELFKRMSSVMVKRLQSARAQLLKTPRARACRKDACLVTEGRIKILCPYRQVVLTASPHTPKSNRPTIFAQENPSDAEPGSKRTLNLVGKEHL